MIEAMVAGIFVYLVIYAAFMPIIAWVIGVVVLLIAIGLAASIMRKNK